MYAYILVFMKSCFCSTILWQSLQSTFQLPQKGAHVSHVTDHVLDTGPQLSTTGGSLLSTPPFVPLIFVSPVPMSKRIFEITIHSCKLTIQLSGFLTQERPFTCPKSWFSVAYCCRQSTKLGLKMLCFQGTGPLARCFNSR